MHDIILGDAVRIPIAGADKKVLEAKNPRTVKPIKLMSYLISIGSRPGDTILDPFVVSGTTIVASVPLNRNAIGIDNDENSVIIAKNRLKDVITTNVDMMKIFFN